jgi:hypothetical protein
LDIDFRDIDNDSTNNDGIYALAFHKSAAALITATSIKTEIDYKPEYQGTLVVGSHVMGAAALRRQSACIITADD